MHVCCLIESGCVNILRTRDHWSTQFPWNHEGGSARGGDWGRSTGKRRSLKLHYLISNLSFARATWCAYCKLALQSGASADVVQFSKMVIQCNIDSLDQLYVHATVWLLTRDHARVFLNVVVSYNGLEVLVKWLREFSRCCTGSSTPFHLSSLSQRRNCRKKVASTIIFIAARYVLKLMHACSSQMAAVAIQEVLREKEVWICGGAEGRYASRACEEDHPWPWGYDTQEVPEWQESVPGVIGYAIHLVKWIYWALCV